VLRGQRSSLCIIRGTYKSQSCDYKDPQKFRAANWRTKGSYLLTARIAFAITTAAGRVACNPKNHNPDQLINHTTFHPLFNGFIWQIKANWRQKTLASRARTRAKAENPLDGATSTPGYATRLTDARQRTYGRDYGNGLFICSCNSRGLHDDYAVDVWTLRGGSPGLGLW
jgi:hypothetical protein